MTRRRKPKFDFTYHEHSSPTRKPIITRTKNRHVHLNPLIHKTELADKIRIIDEEGQELQKGSISSDEASSYFIHTVRRNAGRFARLDLVTEKLFKGGRYSKNVITREPFWSMPFSEVRLPDGVVVYSVKDIPKYPHIIMATLMLPTDKHFYMAECDFEKSHDLSLNIILQGTEENLKIMTALRVPVMRYDIRIPEAERGKYGHIFQVTYGKGREGLEHQNSYTTIKSLENGLRRAIESHI